MHIDPPRSGRAIARLAALWVLLLARPSQAAPQDIDTLVSRLAAAYLAGTSTGSAASILGSLGTDGCWTDVDYADQSQTSWKPVTHLSRVRSLAAAYQKSGHALYQDAATLTAIGQALDCWYVKAPKSSNWWHNDIGKQLQLGPIGILLTNELSSARKQKIIDDLQTTPSFTGQNRVWISQNVVLRGCLERSESRIDTGLKGIKETVVVAASNAEGVQPDYSFHQHGPLLYSAGYGLGFISDTSTWAHHTRGTLFAFNTQQVDVLLGLLLDGDRWMVRGKMFDYSADGREISRPKQSANALIGAAQRLGELAPTRAAECTALADHIAGTAPAPLAGNRHFPHSDFMAHHRADFYVSVKLASNRTYGTECINQENLKGNWLPFGLTYLARRGDEYEDIFPLWDWTHLPGVTSAAFTSCPKAQKAAKAFAGGASDGHSGVAAMQLDELGTRAQKSWFFFDREIVALGAGIGSTRSEQVSTTLNQSFRVGTVTVDGQAQAAGEKALAGVGWVHHDETGYLPLAGTTAFSLRHGSVSGNWTAINAAQSSATITKDLFALWIDHGIKPQGASYGYAILPAINTTALAAYAQKPAVQVLVNTTATQAVQHTALGLLGVVFHQAATVQNAGLTVSVSQPCILLLDTSRSHETRLTIANPLGTLLKIDVDVTRNGQAHHASFDVDGRSQTQTWPQTTVGDSGPRDTGLARDGAIDAASLTDGIRDAPSEQGSAAEGGAAGEGKAQLSGGCGCGVAAGQDDGAWLLLLLCALALAYRAALRPASRRPAVGRAGLAPLPLPFHPGLLENLAQHRGRLGSRDTEATIEDEEGHATNAVHRRLVLVGTYGRSVGVTGERCAHGGCIEPHLAGQTLEHLAIADGLALAEIGAQEALLGRIAEIVLGGEVQQAMRIEGIAGPDDVETKRQPIGRGRRSHGVDHLLSARRRGLILLRQPLDVGRIGRQHLRRPGIELEGAPAQTDRSAMVEVGKGCFEAPLAHVAPGARDVRPDIDTQHGSRSHER